MDGLSNDTVQEIEALPQQNTIPSIRWALVIGISKFIDPKINLKYPAKDADDFYNYLVVGGQFDRSHVVLLQNETATRTNILSSIADSWLPRVANPDDLAVIYISSHRSPADIDVGGVNYLLAHDTNLECLYATGIPLQDLMRTIKARVHSERVVIILHDGYSGSDPGLREQLLSAHKTRSLCH
jgi:hypothetical protein